MRGRRVKEEGKGGVELEGLGGGGKEKRRRLGVVKEEEEEGVG